MANIGYFTHISRVMGPLISYLFTGLTCPCMNVWLPNNNTGYILEASVGRGLFVEGGCLLDDFQGFGIPHFWWIQTNGAITIRGEFPLIPFKVGP